MALIRLNNQSLTNVTALPAAIPTGKVLQVVNASVTAKDTVNITSAGVYQNTSLNLNITPSSASSKILITGSFIYGNAGGNLPARLRIDRGGTAITSGLGHMTYVGNGESEMGTCGVSVLDAPATTSQLTYTVQITRDGTGNCYFNGNYYQSGSESFLTAIEIAS